MNNLKAYDVEELNVSARKRKSPRRRTGDLVIKKQKSSLDRPLKHKDSLFEYTEYH